MSGIGAWLAGFVFMGCATGVLEERAVAIPADLVSVAANPGNQSPIRDTVSGASDDQLRERSWSRGEMPPDADSPTVTMGKPVVVAQEGQRDLGVIERKPSQPSTRPSHKRWAVVIGINGYHRLPQLRYAVSDAQAVAEKLESLGFDEIISLTDEAATKAGVERTLNELKNKVGPEDSVLVFYAGHGQTQTLADGSKMGYWLPVDGDRNNYIATAISMDTLRLLSQAIPARHVLYIMDACYSGLALRQVWLGEGERLSRQIITAGRAGEVVVEVGGHGLFTMKLLQALEGKADFDHDGTVMASELGVFLQSAVSHASGGRQHPVFGRWSGEEEFAFPVRGGTTATGPRPIPGGPVATPRPSAGLWVMVIIPEVLDNSPTLIPSGEIAVVRRLLEAGYEVIDQGQIAEIRNAREVQGILSTGNTAPARAIGQQYGADFVIIGQGVAQHVGNILGSRLNSSRARIEAKMIRISTSEIVASPVVQAAGVDLAPTLAGKKALDKAGDQLADKLIARLKRLGVCPRMMNQGEASCED